MTRRVNYRTGDYMATTLQCGHRTDAPPVSVYPGGRKLWRCPQGCGLQKRTTKKATK